VRRRGKYTARWRFSSARACTRATWRIRLPGSVERLARQRQADLGRTVSRVKQIAGLAMIEFRHCMELKMVPTRLVTFAALTRTIPLG